MNTKNFNEFANACRAIADNLQTLVKVDDYSQFGWGHVAFMTDMFGGTYVCLHYDMQTNEVVNWYGHKEAKEIGDLNSLSRLVKKEMKKMLKARDFDALSEFINSQY